MYKIMRLQRMASLFGYQILPTDGNCELLQFVSCIYMGHFSTFTPLPNLKPVKFSFNVVEYTVGSK